MKICGLFNQFAAVFFISFVYFCLAIVDLDIQWGGFGILLISLTLPLFCVCLRPVFTFQPASVIAIPVFD